MCESTDMMAGRVRHLWPRALQAGVIIWSPLSSLLALHGDKSDLRKLAMRAATGMLLYTSSATKGHADNHDK